MTAPLIGNQESTDFVETPAVYTAREVLHGWGTDESFWPERSIERYAIRIAHALLKEVRYPDYEEEFR